ncbi:MAG: ribosome small subunit-dependent GTPase A [Nocardioides sp.]
MDRYEEYDHERFDRPRRRTRPRTKDRPSHDDAVPGSVVTVDRGRYTCLVDGHLVTAMKSRPLGRKGVVVGDRVQLVGDVSGDDGSLARIVSVDERVTVLRRTADDDDPVERVIVAHADQLVVVAALADPEPRRRLIDRALVAAFVAGLDPLLCLTKSDLADPEPLLAAYRPLGVPAVVTRQGGDLSEVRARLAGRVSVLVGHSGVGKSTLVNALVPGTDRAIGHVNAVTGRGRHTSTSVLMLALPAPGPNPAESARLHAAVGNPAESARLHAAVGDGWIIDTPGIRSFGLAHVDSKDLIAAFPDLDALTGDCPRGCSHGVSEPECGLDEAVVRGRTGAERVESFRRLLEARERAEED